MGFEDDFLTCSFARRHHGAVPENGHRLRSHPIDEENYRKRKLQPGKGNGAKMLVTTMMMMMITIFIIIYMMISDSGLCARRTRMHR